MLLPQKNALQCLRSFLKWENGYCSNSAWLVKVYHMYSTNHSCLKPSSASDHSSTNQLMSKFRCVKNRENLNTCSDRVTPGMFGKTLIYNCWIYFYSCYAIMPVRNSLLSAPVSTPASPIKATFSLLMGDDFFCLCHCTRPLSSMFCLDTVMSNLCPSVFTAALMLLRTSSRLGKKKKTKITAKIFNTINCCNKCKIVYPS